MAATEEPPGKGDEMAALNFDLDGDWTAEELGSVLKAFDRCYTLLYLSRYLSGPEGWLDESDLDWRIKTMMETPGLFVLSGTELALRSIHMASPGGMELAGIGAFMTGLAALIRVAAGIVSDKKRAPLALARERFNLASNKKLWAAVEERLATASLQELLQVAKLFQVGKIELREDKKKPSGKGR